MLIFCVGSRDINCVCLFSGSDPKARFSDVLRDVINRKVTETDLAILLCDSCAALDPNLSCTHDPSKARDSELIG